jgi:hypothetical protein
MSPPVMLTALLCVTAVGQTVTATALVLAWRWRIRARDTGQRLDVLAERLARLEARGAGAAPPNPLPSKPVRISRRRADRAAATAMAGPTLIAVPDLSDATGAGGPDPHASSAAVAELGRRFGAIWEMADAGAPAGAIARATGLPIGRVELILGLKRQLAGASTSPEAHHGPDAGPVRS